MSADHLNLVQFFFKCYSYIETKTNSEIFKISKFAEIRLLERSLDTSFNHTWVLIFH